MSIKFAKVNPELVERIMKKVSVKEEGFSTCRERITSHVQIAETIGKKFNAEKFDAVEKFMSSEGIYAYKYMSLEEISKVGWEESIELDKWLDQFFI